MSDREKYLEAVIAFYEEQMNKALELIKKLSNKDRA